MSSGVNVRGRSSSLLVYDNVITHTCQCRSPDNTKLQVSGGEEVQNEPANPKFVVGLFLRGGFPKVFLAHSLFSLRLTPVVSIFADSAGSFTPDFVIFPCS